MANKLQKRGQKFLKKFSRASLKASEESKEHIKENVFARFSHVLDIKLLIFEWGLLVLALIMLSTAQAFWFSDSYAADDFIEGGSYTEATLGRVNTLNPLFATTSSEKVLSRLMFATLVKIDYSGHTGMGLAESLTPSEDGQVWTMKLREGLKWSDGKDLTTEDVMFTLGLIQNPAVNTIYGANLENVTISEDATGKIVFKLPAAYADFETALIIPVVPKHELEDAALKTLVEDDFSVTPVTSGAFSFNASQNTTDGERMIYLSENPYYYMGGSMISSFAVKTFSDKDAIVAAINSGAVTATAELSGLEAEKVTATSYEKQKAGINAGVFAFFNTGAGAFKNAELRAAVRQGLDFAKIREAAAGAEALDYPLISSQIKLTNLPTIPAANYNAAKSKISELYSAGGKKANLATVRTGYLPAVAEAFAENLESLGIPTELTVYEETQDFVANVVSRRNYDILIYDIELGADPDLLAYYHSSQANASGLNLSSYRNALVDDLLIGARETLDEALRAKKYESFLEYWVADVPAIGLYRSNMTYIYNKNVRSFGENVRLVTSLDRFSDITMWAAVKGSRDLTP
ncbi:hypothetical protein IKE83_01260 [Candidatus Saccharibacteria bacterium]|nr:hypothetical protein [Candidatus Saccharibacteria bacterium]